MPGRLPPNLAPRGLSREEAAAYVGVGPDLFDALVRKGTVPNGWKLGARRVWDRDAIDRCLDGLSGLVQGATETSPAKHALMEKLRGSR